MFGLESIKEKKNVKENDLLIFGCSIKYFRKK